MTRLYDAHNHLMDERFSGVEHDLVSAAVGVGVVRMVVNGSCVADWEEVRHLALRHPGVQASYGLHPWYLPTRPADWATELERRLAEDPMAGVGETGLDRWILDLQPELRARWHPDLASFEPAGLDEQREVFRCHLGIAARWNRPLSVHCLQAWGPLLEDLRRGPLPERGFLLHSYGGPMELVGPIVELGGYFGFPGYFLHARKERHRDTFRHIPEERLLVETDAPDQPLPPERRTHVHHGADGREWNVPANLAAVAAGLAEVRGTTTETLAPILETNFLRLFGDIAQPDTGTPVPAGVTGPS